MKLQLTNNQTERLLDLTQEEFLNSFKKEISSAEERWMRDTEEGRAYSKKVASDTKGQYDNERSPFFDSLYVNFNEYGDKWNSPRGVEPILEVRPVLSSLGIKRILFKKDGHTDWREYGPVRDLNGFNEAFSHWINMYYDGCLQQQCYSWDDAMDVLNTVGSSAVAGTFKLEDWPEVK